MQALHHHLSHHIISVPDPPLYWEKRACMSHDSCVTTETMQSDWTIILQFQENIRTTV